MTRVAPQPGPTSPLAGSLPRSVGQSPLRVCSPCAGQLLFSALGAFGRLTAAWRPPAGQGRLQAAAGANGKLTVTYFRCLGPDGKPLVVVSLTAGGKTYRLDFAAKESCRM